MATTAPVTSAPSSASPAPTGSLPVARLLAVAPWVALVALSLAVLGVWAVAPVQPSYDSAFALLWGDELVHGTLPVLDAYRSPTQHPLSLAVGIVLGPLDDATAGRTFVLLVLASYVALVAGVFVLARTSFGTLVAWLAAALVLSRLDYASLASRAYIDVPYLALVVWAAALEARTPRRGTAVFVLLGLAGLLRPEAWLLAGLYALWMSWGHGGLVRQGLKAAVAPGIWMASDLAMTGNPIFSLTYTSGSAAALGHRAPLLDVPERTVHYLDALVKTPVLALSAVGLLLAMRLRPRAAALPAGLFAAGIVTFWAIAVAGLAVIARYLAVSGLMALLFAAFALGGFTVLARGARWRRTWAVGAGLGIAGAALFSLTHTSPRYIERDFAVREQVPKKLGAILAHPEVVAARRCGPVTIPNQKLLADVRLQLGSAPADTVFARSDPRARPHPPGGVALFLLGKRLNEHPAYRPFDQLRDPTDIVLPPAGFVPVARNSMFAAYARCPAA